MSTASALAQPLSASPSFTQWLQKGLNNVRSASATSAQSVRPSSGNRQEADKLRALARDMLRIDGSSSADLFATANRCEFSDST